MPQLIQESDQNPSLQDDSLETNGGQNQNQIEQSQDQVLDGQVLEFSHPLLKGKSPKEIEDLVAAQEAAMKSQNTELNNYHTRLSQLESQSTNASTQPKTVEKDEYKEAGFLAPAFQRLEQKLDNKLNEAVAPLRQETVVRRTETAREKLARELPHFTQVETIIDQVLRAQRVDPRTANEESLRFLYHTAVGMAVSNGVNLGTGTPVDTAQPTDGEPSNTSARPRNDNPVNIPQRRPSSAPLPAVKTTEKKRPLTEEERRFANLRGMTEDQFRELQDLPDDEVVKPGFSKDQW